VSRRRRRMTILLRREGRWASSWRGSDSGRAISEEDSPPRLLARQLGSPPKAVAAAGHGDVVEARWRADEQHAREVEGHRQVVVGGSVVMLRVEHLKQGPTKGFRPGRRWRGLSISSSRTPGLLVPALRSPCTMCPAQRADVGARWRGISASVVQRRPGEMRTKLAAHGARAIDWPARVLAHGPAGRPRHRIRLFARRA